jgi:mannitol-1-phosphate 5-dehydrogenase
LYERANTASEFEEALRDHESRTWDFLLAQMADSEVRQRDWKRFKEDVDRRLASRTGLLWRGKLRRSQDGQANASKKWKVGLGT